jgi:ring-1,2-phenylacetyl-CoA epoxidase subunit PaaC
MTTDTESDARGVEGGGLASSGARAADAAMSPVDRATRDLILVLADTKRVLGYRYAEWMLGAPELESGIACSSMAQDEWGHARLLYALLRDFGDDVDALEHGREAAAYRSMEVLDDPVAVWPDLVALMVLADGAVTAQIRALRGSSHTPLRHRVDKVLEEERFHAAHGAAWFRRLAGASSGSREALAGSVERMLEPVLAWFGPESERSESLVAGGVVVEAPSSVRRAFLAEVSPFLEQAGVTWSPDRAPELAGFDESRRRLRSGGPDEATIRRIRGDRNRPFLMD